MASGKTLKLRFHGRIIDHLGIQMYEKPVAAIAELVANAWDADATTVEITLPDSLSTGATIKIVDDGIGMTLKECEDRYLNVGLGRREDDPNERSPEFERPVLGRKGIGKFAGFGIAESITISTFSKETGEKTVFTLNINELRSGKYIDAAKAIPVAEYLEPHDARKKKHGTTITLAGLTLSRRPSKKQFRRSLARRFLFYQNTSDFAVTVNDEKLPESVELAKVQFSFPEEYRKEEKPQNLKIEPGGWGVEKLSNGQTIRWRVFFHEEPIDDEELRGVAVFSRGKIAQVPFFFNLSGGLSGQHAQEYMSGQVLADYLDELDTDIITTERQRIRWEHKAAAPLLEWGQERVKQLLGLWRDRRGEKRMEELDKKVARFSDRLEKLPGRESKTVQTAIRRIAQVPTLSKAQFGELGEALLTAWEGGRLKVLISDIAEADDMSEQQLLEVLLEAQVLTALNVAEAVKTKLLVVGGLRERIKDKQLELAVRDFISEHPWLVAPEWETFKIERSVKGLLKDVGDQLGYVDKPGKKRIDLALSSGQHLLILEFMRPGETLDWDHISRFERYIRKIRKTVEANTAGQFRQVTGYIVADKLEKNAESLDKIKSMKAEGMFALDWRTLLSGAAAKWKDFLEILSSRSDDPRLKALNDE
jgi:hypothetical protein